jgi:RNA-directed DNA polymerase
MKKKLKVNYCDIISLDNLLLAWQEFVVGKRDKKDVVEFSLNFADNILQLHDQLVNLDYQHGGYHGFYISDPKLRHIHKASVRDRLVHHAVYRLIYPFFSKIFIAHSYSCQLNKGAHRALRDFQRMAIQVSQNNNKTCWVLQCDISKFFDSIDHQLLLKMLERYITDKKIFFLLKNIINSFETYYGKGLPLGNLTSQLFVNIYMNVFDQYIKHGLKAEHYIRYADDFIVLSPCKKQLILTLSKIKGFLSDKLKLELHPKKVYLKTLASGIDFLGWIHFSQHRVLRNKTRCRMMRKIRNNAKPESLASYLGLLKHGNSYKVRQELLNNYWINFFG